ncbi:MAG TPA: efflux RND transporter periplasmic adaptor subunit [Gammaproteobacteria bacterium]|nr:efflux RND transporter periplasmic adaptor subunit [Gammaproteobacteria bacterium]
MHTTRRIAAWTAVIAAIGAAIWYATRPEPVTVVVEEATLGKVEETVANTRVGTVEACRRTRLSSAVGGQVDRLLVDEGDTVEKGQLLLELWNDDLEARLAVARSEADAAQANTREACLRADNAEREYQRAQRLFDKALTSEEDVDRARTEAQSLRAACAAARARAKVARDQVASAEANLARTRLYAPFSGIVAEVTGEPGEYTTPSPPGIPTPPAVDLIEAGCLYVTAPIDEVDAPRIEKGMQTRITLDAFGDRVFPGKVRRIAPYVLDVEKQARTVDVEVDFDEETVNRELLPGYSADVEIVLNVRSETLRVPTEAVLQGDRVLVYLPGSGELAERALQTGLANWEHTEVLNGLEEGDRVVTSVDREGVEPGASVELEKPGP